jgi:hypothetical protein
MKSPRRICLIKIGTGEKQRTHLIDRTDFTVGRSPEADIVLPSTSASRLHAKFSFSSRQDAKAVTLSVEDLGSANGTFVNDERLTPHTPITLTEGARVRVAMMMEEIECHILPLPFELSDLETARMVTREFLIQAFADEEKKLQESFDREREALRKQMNLEIERERAKVEATAGERLLQANREAETAAEKILSEARLEGDRLKAKSRDEATQIFSSMEREAAQLRQQTADILSKTQREAAEERERRMQDVRKEAEQLLEQAKADARRDHERHLQESQRVLNAAKLEAEEVIKRSQAQAISQREQEHQSQARELERQRLQVVADAREKATQEQDAIVANYKTLIQELKDKLEQFRARFTETEAKREQELREVESRHKLLADLEARCLQAKTELYRVDEQLAQANKLIADGKAAAEQRVVDERTVAALKVQIQDLEQKRQNDLAKSEDEVALRRTQLAVDFERERKAREDQAHRERLETMERLKNELATEETRYRELLRHKATEIATQIELKVLPRLQKALADTPTSVSERALADAQIAVRESVAHVTESNVTSISLAAMSDGAKAQKTSQAIRQGAQALGWAAVGLIVMGIFNWRTVVHYFENRERVLASLLATQDEARRLYVPVRTTEWRDSYVDRVLFLDRYLETKTNSIYLDQWTLRLQDVELARRLGLKDDDLIRFLAIEANMIKKLDELRRQIDATQPEFGINVMRNFENAELQNMRAAIRTQANFEALIGLEREFTLGFIKREKR